MDKNSIVNNKILSLDNSVLNFFTENNFGLKLYSINKISERIENFSNYPLKTLSSSQLASFFNLIFDIIPLKKSFKVKFLVNIFFLDIISSYRGWRHSKGLPVRGQRTWSNAWNSYRTNLTLREYKISLVKRLYGNLPVNELNVAYLAEQVNLLWKLQWEQEWKEAKKKRVATLKKDAGITKIDLYSMSQGMVGNYSKKADKSKKQKSGLKKNYFTLGFDPGFTKALLKNKLMTSKKGSGKTVVMLNSGDSKVKKKIVKKKK